MNTISNWLNSFSNNEDGSMKPKQEENIFKKNKPQKNTKSQKKPVGKRKPGNNKHQTKNNSQKKENFHGALKVIPLGGVDDTGALNSTIVEYKNDILIVDAGLGFPEDEHPGVDYLIPNMEYLSKNKHKIRGILITHGHLDHIGALPHMLDKLGNIPIYASRYAIALIKHRLAEFKLDKSAKLVLTERHKEYKFGSGITSEWIHINHSLPDARAIFLRSPEGNIFFSGDFKIDYTPEKEETADFAALTKASKDGVDLLFSDSLGVGIPGHVPSERVIRKAFEKLFEDSKDKGRILIGQTASNSNRFQQIIDTAAKYGRKIGISGRSLETNMRITQELGYLDEVKGVLIPPDRLNKLPDNKIVFMVTGSQGEEFAALNRISKGEHKDIQIKKGDTIVFSASEIIGNERPIAAMRNRLMMQGANIVNNKTLTVHSSGHGCAEDKRLLLTLLKPKYFLPYHGEFFFRTIHAEIATETGVEQENIFLTSDGVGIEMFKRKARVMKETIPAQKLLVDGRTLSDQDGSVLQERLQMGQDGLLLVMIKLNKDRSLHGNPKLISRGFLYENELQKIKDDLTKFTKKTYEEILKEDSKASESKIVNLLSKAMGRQIRKITNRTPIVNPILIKI